MNILFRRKKVIYFGLLCALIPVIVIFIVLKFILIPSRLPVPIQKKLVVDFNDIHKTPYEASIDILRNQRIIHAYEDGTFRPSVQISRAEFLEILFKGFHIVIENQIEDFCFTDVNKDDWFAPYACYVKKKEIISNNPDGSFRPTNSISYREGIEMIYKINNNPGKTYPKGRESFSRYVEDASEKNIALSKLGKDYNHFLTRGESVELIWRYMFKLGDDLTGRGFIPQEIKPDYPVIIEKKSILLKNHIEVSPFIWQNELMYLVSKRPISSVWEPNRFELSIYRFRDNKKIASFGSRFSLASAIVKNNVLYVTANTDFYQYGHGGIYLFTSHDLQNFSEPKLLYKAHAGQRIFNNSIALNEFSGKATMVLEVDEKNLKHFSFRFLESDDMERWQVLDVPVFAPTTYVGSPFLIYDNGKYYLFYLISRLTSSGIIYSIKVARSNDLIEWVVSPYDVLFPEKGEGNNNSDAEFIEYNNQLYIFYATGDQKTWGDLKYAIYNESLMNYLWNFFNG